MDSRDVIQRDTARCGLITGFHQFLPHHQAWSACLRERCRQSVSTTRFGGGTIIHNNYPACTERPRCFASLDTRKTKPTRVIFFSVVCVRSRRGAKVEPVANCCALVCARIAVVESRSPRRCGSALTTVPFFLLQAAFLSLAASPLARSTRRSLAHATYPLHSAKRGHRRSLLDRALLSATLRLSNNLCWRSLACSLYSCDHERSRRLWLQRRRRRSVPLLRFRFVASLIERIGLTFRADPRSHALR